MNARYALTAALTFAASAHGNTIFSSGPAAAAGWDICSVQSAALRFTPDRDCTLSGVSLWTMSSVPAGFEAAPILTVSIRSDESDSPGSTVIETWARPVTAVGRTAVLEAFPSEQRPLLRAGTSYWIVAQSAAPTDRSPIWNLASSASGLVALGAGGAWTVTTGTALAAEVEADLECSADYDHDGDAASDLDIEAFFACLAGSCCASCGPTDIDGDGQEGTDSDIESFFRVLAGGPC